MGVRGVTLTALFGVLGVLIVGSASAKTPKTVPLSISITGAGTVQVGFHVVSCEGMACHQIVRVRRGRRVVIYIAPWAGWKLTASRGACKGAPATCSIRPFVPAHIAVTFVPPGDRLNPIPLGTAVALFGGLRLRVNSATLDANDQAEAVTDGSGKPWNGPPPAGAQYALVNVSLQYVARGAGPIYLEGFVGNLQGEGSSNAAYAPSCTPPPIDLRSIGQFFYGEAVAGNLCYEIASSDANSLLLGGPALHGGRTVWFALR